MDLQREAIKALSDRIVAAQRPIKVLGAINWDDQIRNDFFASKFEVFEVLRTDGLSEDDAWVTASRVFRGSLPEAGPFTKDLGYGKGLILTLMYVRMAIWQDQSNRSAVLRKGGPSRHGGASPAP